jgi:sugar phosphate isomerase/epimerase
VILNIHQWKVSFIPYYLISKSKWLAPEAREAVSVLAKQGYDGVEWMLGYHFNSSSELKRIVSLTRNKGLNVSNIMCWEDFVTSKERQRTRKVNEICNYIEQAAELSIPIVNTFTGPMSWREGHETLGEDISEGEAWSIVVDSFSKIIDIAEKNDLTVTVEAVFGMLVHDYYTTKEFLSYFDSKNIGVNLDPSHLALYGNDPTWAISMLRNKIRHVHVKDVIGTPGVFGRDFVFPFLGEGIIEWESFFHALKDIGYQGFISVEFENDIYLKNICNGDWRIAARESKNRLDKLLRCA